MSTHADRITLDEAVEITLENHATDEYADILGAYQSGWPAAHTYLRPTAADLDTQADLSEAAETEAKGIRAQAWIDLTGDVAKVRLNPNLYADTPADELQPEAERILTEWASRMRRELDIQTPPPTAR
ncbi:MAG: hypothetical protein ACOCZU_01480 [Planctomycetota bacterium]